MKNLMILILKMLMILIIEEFDEFNCGDFDDFNCCWCSISWDNQSKFAKKANNVKTIKLFGVGQNSQIKMKNCADLLMSKQGNTCKMAVK